MLAFTVAAFYLPMREFFWSGTDTSYMLGIRGPWWDHWDLTQGRPLQSLPPYLALRLTPGSLGGFFVVIVALRFLISLLIYHLTALLLPGARWVGLVAAVLYVVNPSENSRFLLWSIIYYGMVFFFLLAALLYVLSYRIRSRTMLIVACISLGISLLHYETGFPLTVLVLFLPLFAGLRPHFRLWAFTWCATVGLFAMRFVVHLTSETSYQSFLFKLGQPPATAAGWAMLFVDNFLEYTLPLFSFFGAPGALLEYWPVSLRVPP